MYTQCNFCHRCATHVIPGLDGIEQIASRCVCAIVIYVLLPFSLHSLWARARARTEVIACRSVKCFALLTSTLQCYCRSCWLWGFSEKALPGAEITHVLLCSPLHLACRRLWDGDLRPLSFAGGAGRIWPLRHTRSLVRSRLIG